MSKVLNALHDLQNTSFNGSSAKRSRTKIEIFFLRHVGLFFAGLVVLFIAVMFILSNRITSQVSVTQEQLTDVLNYMKIQTAKINELNEMAYRLEKKSYTDSKEMMENIKKINDDFNQKFFTIKADVTTQKAQLNELTETNAKLSEAFNVFALNQKGLTAEVAEINDKVAQFTFNKELSQ